MGPEGSAKVLCSVPKCKKAVIYFVDKRQVSKKFCSASVIVLLAIRSVSTESAMYIKCSIFKQKHTQNQVMY